MVLSDLLKLAFRDSGVFGKGQTPLGEDTQLAIQRLNMMLAQWERRRWLAFHLVDSSVACDGSQSYTVGAGGDIAIARPDQIEAAYIRQVVPSSQTPVDWPLRLITSMEDYSKITLKELAASPSRALFYDSGFPLGRLYPWPLPNANYELHILTKGRLQTFADVGDEIALPPEYEQAIYLNLAVQLRMAYRMKPDGLLIGYAKAALNTIRKSNVQPSVLAMPSGVRRGPSYNIYSDTGSN